MLRHLNIDVNAMETPPLSSGFSESLKRGKEIDTWLIADVHAPIAAEISQHKGCKFGFIRQLRPINYDISGFEALFVFSLFAQETMRRIHPELSSKIYVCRIPWEPDEFQFYGPRSSSHKTIVFIQPFRSESLHLLEVYCGEMLQKDGYQVLHLFRERENSQNLDRCLLREGKNRGMDFVFCSDIQMYYARLAQARLVMNLEWSGCVTHLLTAAALGVPVAVPAYGAYPSFFPRTCLFPPLNLLKAMELAIHPPEPISFEQYGSAEIASDYQVLTEVHP
jgi:hypothetical protein